MRKALVFIVVFIALSGFSFHKFYVSIFQLHHSPDKKRLEITTRLFVDDLNKALQDHYHQTTHLGEETETAADIALMNRYIAENFTIEVNGQKKPFAFVSKELDNNVLVGYYKINDIPKIKSLKILNTVLTQTYAEQQNMIQADFNGKKQSLLLTAEKTSGVLK